MSYEHIPLKQAQLSARMLPKKSDRGGKVLRKRSWFWKKFKEEHSERIIDRKSVG